jgi:endoglucanase
MVIRRVLISCIVGAVVAVAVAGVAAPSSALSGPAVTGPSGGPFSGGLYVENGTDAQAAVARLSSEGQTASAQLVEQIASQPTAIWLGDWYSDALLKSVIQRNVTAAGAQGRTLVFVTYAIPDRDCGGYSAGGFDAAEYLDWNQTIATALAGTHAVVLIEPDSLSMLASPACAGMAAERLPLIRSAVDILAGAGLSTYLDGGNSRWLTPTAQAAWLNQAGIADATGFFTNVSNFNPTQQENDYAGKVSSRVGWKHFVIDVSRNGAGSTGEWCNPAGAGLGANPRVSDGTGKLDALLWVKHAGASDGSCDGNPAAGDWSDALALGLIANR